MMAISTETCVINIYPPQISYVRQLIKPNIVTDQVSHLDKTKWKTIILRIVILKVLDGTQKHETRRDEF